MKRSALLVYLSLLADVVVFFHKPLFSTGYSFPWDFHGVQLPLITFLSDQLKQGRLALWNPYNYCGYPAFENIEACFFHPLVFLSALVSSHTSLDILPLMLEWIVVLQIWFAGIAAYHLFRELGTGRPAAWAGAIIFQTGGYFASRAEHIGAVMAVAWMPLAWLAIFKLRHGLRLNWLAALAAALGMAILGGFPQPTLAVFVSTVVLAATLVTLRLARIQLVATTAAGCVLGIALASIQFIPTVQLSQHSVAKYRAGWLGTGGGLYWQSLVSLVLPNHYNLFDMRRFHGPGDISFLYLYSSVAGVSLALIAPFVRRTRYVAALGIMLFVGMLWMLGDKTPLWRLVYPMLPETVRIGIHPEYVYCIFTLALAGLAAMGLDALRIADCLRWAVGVVIAVDLFLVGSGRPMNCASLADDPVVTRQSFEGSAPLLAEVRRDVDQGVDQNAPPWRIDTVDASINWATGAPITRVPDANGVSPLALENIIQLRLFLHEGHRWGWYYPVENVDSPVLDLMNVKYLITRPQAAARLWPNPRYRHVKSLAGYELFENLQVMPRFFLVREIKPAASLAGARGLIDSGTIDFRQTAIAEKPISLPAGSPSPGFDRDEVKVSRYQPDSLELSVRSGGAALLVLSESYYPGWKAWLDGSPTEIYRADIAFRGVAVPPGDHRVRMEFHPAILTVSAALSLATAILLLGLAYRR
ncbi:MAG: YfhO family protein [Bryobacteraceae bacterium]